MRKTTLSILMLSLVAVVMTSCNLFKSEQERKIVGKWYSAATDVSDTAIVVDDGITARLTADEYCTYDADKKVYSNGTLQITYNLYDEYSIILKYKISYTGTWEIKDGRLYEKPTDASVVFAGMELSDPNLYELQQAANAAKQELSPYISEMKSDLLTPSDSKIVKVDDNELVLSDEDGPTTYRRLN